MTERPIIMSTPMVQAILAGCKTQTRRLVKGEALRWLEPPVGFLPSVVADPANSSLCPYGKPGDRLWVRETHAILHTNQPTTAIYRATHDPVDAAGLLAMYGTRWKPSIHMPRAACRLWLEITEIRVERLHDISEADAIAEGVAPDHVPGWRPHVHAFKELWQNLHGETSWDHNPWVWVIEFRRVEAVGHAD